MELQLTVDTAGGDLGELAYRWLDEVSLAQAGETRAAVADAPTRGGRGRFMLPGGDFAYLRIDRWPEGRPPRYAERSPSRAGLAWLRKELTDVPRKVTLEFGHLEENGMMSCARSVLAERHDVAPDQVVLRTYLDESELTGSVETQRQYLDLLRGLADSMNPAFGHIAYAGQGSTAFEAGLRNIERVPPPEWWSYPDTLACCREALRGYSWLTILPQELLDRVGGLQALTASGAFADVRQLANGGVWLLATDDYRAFDDAALLRVFSALAPALRPGPVTLLPPVQEDPPLRVVPKDAGRDRDPTTPWWWTATVEDPAPASVDIEPAAPGEVTDTLRNSHASWWITTLMVETVVPTETDPVDAAQILADAVTRGMLQMRAEVGYVPVVPDAAVDPHAAGSPLSGPHVVTYFVRLAVAHPRRPEAARIFTWLDILWANAWKRYGGGPKPAFIPVPADVFAAGHAAARAYRSTSGPS